MPDWLYRTSKTHTTETDAAGKPYFKDTWEARVLGQVVYKVTTQSDAAPEPEKAIVTDKKPPTLADKIAHESHWLDIDRTADSRPESPDIPEDHPRKVTNVGVLGFNVWGSNGTSGGKPVMEKESHWLDVDRIADSRAESPVQSEPATPTSPTMVTTGTPASPMSPTKKREMVSSPLAKGA